MKEDSSEVSESTVEDLDPVEDNDVSRVRELLHASEQKSFAGVGAQFSFAFLHRKLDRLEDRLVADNNALREEVRTRVEDLERFFKSELSGVVDALASEEVRRIQAMTKLTDDLQAVTRVFDERAEGLEERFSDMDQKVLRTVKLALQETESRLKALTLRMEKDTRQLQESKADSSKLAQLFADFSTRMNEPPPKR